MHQFSKTCFTLNKFTILYHTNITLIFFKSNWGEGGGGGGLCVRAKQVSDGAIAYALAPPLLPPLRTGILIGGEKLPDQSTKS